MSLAFDENGRPFIILREQEKKKRVKGLEAHKVSYLAGAHVRIGAHIVYRTNPELELSGTFLFKESV